MVEKLPNGWIKTTLGEITNPSRVRALPSGVPSTPYVGLEHIESQSMKLVEHGYARDIRSSALRFSKGDVLYGRMRPYLNKVWVAEFDGLCSPEFIVFPKLEGLNASFLAMRLNAEDFVAFANGQVSGERPRVGFDKLARFPILLPPLAEQERIVAKLSAALSGVGRAATAARRAQERLERYRGAVLDAALNGKLTHEWRRDVKPSETTPQLLKRLLHERRAHWEEAELERLRTVGRIPKDDNWKSKYPEPIEPEIAGLPEAPAGWAWASAEQLTEASRPIS